MTTPNLPPQKEMMEMLKVELIFCGPAALHNMPCSICTERKAVFNCNLGFFSPCWECQKQGWVTKKESGIKKFISRFWVGLEHQP